MSADDPTIVRTTKVTQKFDTAQDVADLVEEIRRKEDSLETILLEGNSYGIEPLRAIGEALSMCHRLRHLLMNDMFVSRLKTEIPEALSLMFGGVMASSARIETLSLSDNAIGPVTMPALTPFLQSESCSKLKVLRLNNCGLGITGGGMLSKVLPCLESLQELVIGRNRLEIDGVRDISQALLKLSHLEVLELPQNGTKGEGIVALTAAIRANRNLRVLNINDNVLRGKSDLLASAIKQLPRLEVLNLGDCLLKTTGANHILTGVIEGIQSAGTSALQEIILNGNEIGKSAAGKLLDALDQIVQKRVDINGVAFRLDLSCNNLGEDLVDLLQAQFADSVELVIDEDEGSADEAEDGDEDGDVTAGGDEEEAKQQNGSRDDDQETDLETLVAKYEAHYTTVGSLCSEFFRVAVKGLQTDHLSEPAIAQIEALLKVGLIHQTRDAHFGLVNGLLVACGLLKGEDKSAMPAKGQDLTGPLLALGAALKHFTDLDQKKCIRQFLQKAIDDPKYEKIKSNLFTFIYSF